MPLLQTLPLLLILKLSLSVRHALFCEVYSIKHRLPAWTSTTDAQRLEPLLADRSRRFCESSPSASRMRSWRPCSPRRARRFCAERQRLARCSVQLSHPKDKALQLWCLLWSSETHEIDGILEVGDHLLLAVNRFLQTLNRRLLIRVGFLESVDPLLQSGDFLRPGWCRRSSFDDVVEHKLDIVLRRPFVAAVRPLQRRRSMDRMGDALKTYRFQLHLSQKAERAPLYLRKESLAHLPSCKEAACRALRS